MKKYRFIFLFIFLVGAWANQANAQNRAADSLALRNLYFRTKGASWGGIASVPWNLTQPMSAWGGVTLTNGRVTSLILSGVKMTGSLSDSIANLTELTVLNLSNNSLTGTVPTRIATSLTKLVTLNLSKNQFTSIPDLTTITTLGSVIVNNNQLGFASLEPNVGKFSTFTYLPETVGGVTVKDTLGIAVKIGTSTTKDSTITLNEGDVFSYTIKVSGANNLYQWFREGVSLSSQTPESVLSIPDATKNTQNGKYLLEVSNTRVAGLTFYRKLTIIINPCKIVGSRIDKDQSICEGGVFPTLQGTAPTGSKGTTLSYQWQRGVDKKNWTNIGIGQNLKIGSLPDTATYFRRIASDGRCVSDTSNTITIRYYRKLANNIISSAQTICLGDTARTLRGTKVTGGDGKYAYQWQYSTNLKEWTDADGSADYKPIDLLEATYFRRIASDKTCFKDTSNIVRVLIVKPFGGNIIGKDQSICPRGKIAVLVDTTGASKKDTVNYRFQWQASLDKKNWLRADTATKADTMLRLYPELKLTKTTYFRRIVTSPCKKDTSNIITISIFGAIANNRIQANIPVYCDGDTTKVRLTGNVPINGGGSYRYTWQTSLDKKNWNNRGDSLRLVLNSITDTTYFRRIVRSACYADTSNIITMFKAFAFGTNRITSPNQLNCSNLQADSLRASRPTGKGFFTYIWQSSPDSINWAKIDSTGNKINYGPPKKMALGKIYFRRVVDNGCTLNISNVVYITTVSGIEENTISGSQSVCEGQSIREITGTVPRGGGGGYKYRWQVSTDSLKTWSLADTLQNFKPQGITKISYYRRIVIALQCGVDTSNVVKVGFVNKVRNNIIKDNQEICLGAKADSLSGSLPTGGDGKYTYIWQQNVTDSTWKTIANTRNYTPDLLRSTKFRRIVQSSCFSDTSNTAFIAVNEPVTNNRILGTGLLVCRGVQPDTLRGSNPTDNVGVFQYQWQVSKDRRVWTSIPRAVGRDLAPPIPDSTSYYRRIAQNKCFIDTSLTVSIRLLELPKVDAGKDTTVTIGFGVRLLATGANSFVWRPKEGLDRDSTATPIASPRVTTTYIVTGIDAAGCRNVDSVLVRVNNEADVDVVDVITPNGDGLNDILYVKNIELYPQNSIIIFNRWGKEILQRKNYKNDWDGTINGELLPTGVYFYVIQFGLTSRAKKGSFSIIN